MKRGNLRCCRKMIFAGCSWRVYQRFTNSYVGSFCKVCLAAGVETFTTSFDPALIASGVTLKPDKSCLWMNGSIGQTWGATRATGHFDSRVSLDWSATEMSQWSHFVGSPKQLPRSCMPVLIKSSVSVITFTDSFSLFFISLQTPIWQTFLKSGASIS